MGSRGSDCAKGVVSGRWVAAGEGVEVGDGSSYGVFFFDGLHLVEATTMALVARKMRAEKGLHKFKCDRLPHHTPPQHEHIDVVVLNTLVRRIMIVAEARADLEEWNRKNPEQRIVVFSGYSAQDASARFAGQNLNGFLQKPFSSEASRL